ncbi:MAG: SAM-dependent methyltransferase, partial [Jatrophihabitans sp.]|nr:SAM-dependent methyltransferase [Jatrophihabitans sp.]
MTDEGYLLDNRVAAAGDRFTALAQLFDPVTLRHVDALGITSGWRCWEVGAGGASVP